MSRKSCDTRLSAERGSESRCTTRGGGGDRHDAAAYHKLLSWSTSPNWDQLEFICGLMWKHWNGARIGARSILTSKHLAFSINRLQSSPSMHALIEDQLEYLHKSKTGNVDEAVQQTLDFTRLWAMFNFPKLLRALDHIQADVYACGGMAAGSYETFAAGVENLFLDPAIVALDEYGLPLELGRKLEPLLQPHGSLDVALAALRGLPVETLQLEPFEADVLRDTVSSI